VHTPRPSRRRWRRLAAAAALVVVGSACRPGVLVQDGSVPNPTSTGYTATRIRSTAQTPGYSDGVGAFRVSCRFSHMAWDDPIVAPNQPGGSHLHTFFGNTGVNAMSTAPSIATSGASTCTGGTANRTAYWVPTMLAVPTAGAPGTPVTNFHGISPSWTHIASLDGSEALQVYYKTGYQGVPAGVVQNFPAGLRMIAGSATRTSPTGSGNPIVSYDCISPYNTSGHIGTESIPACAAGNLLTMTVRFPQCWDGRNLDSADHKSHMAYGTWGVGCPATHPVALPEVTFNVRWLVQPGQDTRTWRLSSDMYSGPGGYSGHADWFNGWDQPTFQRVVDNCLRPGRDCHMNLLGDGRELYGPM
jgi:hypothetical protein